MRILFYIQSSQPKTNSAVLFFIQLAKRILEEGNIIYFYAPDYRVIKFIREQLEKDLEAEVLKRVGFFNESFNLNTFFLEVIAPNIKRLVTLFNAVEGIYPVDIIITNDPLNAPIVSAAIGHSSFVRTTDFKSFVPVICIEPNYIELWFTNKDYLFMRKLLTPYVGKYVLLSPNELSMCLQDSYDYFGGRNIRVKPEFKNIVSIDLNKLDQYLVNNSVDHWKLCWGGRLTLAKNVHFIAKVYSLFGAFHKDVEIIWTTPSFTSLPDLKIHKNIKVLYGVDRQKYFEIMSRGKGIVLLASHIEGYPVGFFEMIYLGNVPVFLKKAWIKGIIPPGYPFIAKNYTEALGFIEYLFKNEDAYNRWINEWRDYLRKLLGKNTLDDYIGFINELKTHCFNSEEQIMFNKKVEAIVDFLKTSKFNGEVWGLKDIEDKIKLRAESENFQFARGLARGSFKFPTHYDVYYFFKFVVKLKEIESYEPPKFIFDQQVIDEFLKKYDEHSKDTN